MVDRGEVLLEVHERKQRYEAVSGLCDYGFWPDLSRERVASPVITAWEHTRLHVLPLPIRVDSPNG